MPPVPEALIYGLLRFPGMRPGEMTSMTATFHFCANVFFENTEAIPPPHWRPLHLDEASYRLKRGLL
jgi:hypothetical protein